VPHARKGFALDRLKQTQERPRKKIFAISSKMINAFGAPIDQADAKTIADYLAKNYGTALSAAAKERQVHLVRGPGLDKVEAHCSACHSLDYVVMNSPFLNASGWDAEVAKMINAFGAPIDQADAKVIADYLKRNYGHELLDQIEARLAVIDSPSLEKDKSIPEPSSPNFEIAHEKYDTKRAGTPRVVSVPRTSNHASLRRTSFDNRDTSVCSAFQSCSGHEPLLLGIGF
jgi:hypothetical protein